VRVCIYICVCTHIYMYMHIIRVYIYAYNARGNAVHYKVHHTDTLLPHRFLPVDEALSY
jgi:hypothetical protein